MLKQLNKFEANVGHIPDAKARLLEREGAFQRKTYKAEENAGRTIGQINAARKEADVDNLTKKYGTVTIGIHGQELPKFNDDLKEYWRETKGFVEKPAQQSVAWLKQTHKYWAKPDEMRLADVNASNTAAPIDPFKVDHTPQKYKFDVAPHVHKVTHWKKKEDEYAEEAHDPTTHKKVHTWSELEKMFRCEGDERLVDKIIKAAEYRECAIEESIEKAAKLNALGFASPKKRDFIIRGKESEMKNHQPQSSKKSPSDKIRVVERNSVMRTSVPSNENGGNYTSR